MTEVGKTSVSHRENTKKRKAAIKNKQPTGHTMYSIDEALSLAGLA